MRITENLISCIDHVGTIKSTLLFFLNTVVIATIIK